MYNLKIQSASINLILYYISFSYAHALNNSQPANGALFHKSKRGKIGDYYWGGKAPFGSPSDLPIYVHA